MKEENNKSSHVVHNYFYGSIGQHIDHIDTQYVTFDKDMNMHIGQVNTQQTQEETKEVKSECTDYTKYIETTTSITVIGSLLVNEAKEAKTKAAFINKISQIVSHTQLFHFRPTTTNEEKAIFTNAILKAYKYPGGKCDNITHDDFQRYF